MPKHEHLLITLWVHQMKSGDFLIAQVTANALY